MTSANRARDLFFQKLRDREQQQPSTSQPGTTSTSRPTDESTQGTNSNNSALVGLLPMSFLRSPSLSPPVPEEQSRTLPFGQHGLHTRTVTASPPPAAVSFGEMVPMAAANCSISLLGNSSGNALAPETTTTSSLLANVLPSFHTLASSPRPLSQQQPPQQPYHTTTTTAARFPMFPNGAYLGIGGSTATGSGSDVSSVQRTPPQLGRPHQREPAFQLFRSTTSGGGVGGTQRNSTSFHAGNASTLSPVVGGAGEGQVSGSASVGSFVAHVSFPSWHPGGSTTTALQLAPSDEGSISQLQQSRNAAAGGGGGGPTHHLHHSQSRDVAARSALDVAGSSVSHNGNSIMMLPLPPPPSLQPNGDGGSSVLSVPLLTGNPSALPNHSSSTPTSGTNITSNLTLGSCNLTSVVATSSSNAVALRRFTAKSFNSQRAGPLGTANSDMVATASSNDFAAMSTMFLQDAGLAAGATSDATPSDERTAGEAQTSSESRVRNPSTGTNTNSAGAAVSSAGLHRDHNSNAARYYGEEDEGADEGTDRDLLAGDGEVHTAMSSITHYEANFSAPRPGTSITTTATAHGGGGSVSTTTLSVAGREVASCLPPAHQHNAQRRERGGDVTTVVELSRPIPRIPQQEHNQDVEEDHLLQDKEETTPSPQLQEVPTTTSQSPPTFPNEALGPQRPVIVEEESAPNAMRDPPVCALVPQDNTSSLWQQWGPTSSTAATIPAVQTVARCDISFVPATDLSSYARTDSSKSAGSHTKCAPRTKSFVTEEDEGGPSSLAAPTSNDASLRQPHAPPSPPLPHDDDAPRRAIVHHSQPHDLHCWDEKASNAAAAACLVPNQHSNEAMMMMMMHRNPLPLPLPTLSSSLPRSQSRTTSSSNTSQGGPPPPAAPQPPSIPPSLGLASSFVRATPSASLLDGVLTHDESPFPLNVTSFQSSVLGRFNSVLGGGAIHSPMSARTDPASRMSERSHTEIFFSRSDLVTGMLRRPSSSRELSPTTTTTTTTTGAGTTHNGGIWRSSDETHLSVNSTSRLRAGSGMSTLPPTPVECGIAAASPAHHHYAAHPPTKASPSLGPHHPSPRGMRLAAVDTAAAPTDAITAQRDSSTAPQLASLPTRVGGGGGHTVVGTAGSATAAAEAPHADDPLHLTHNEDGTTSSLLSPRVTSNSVTTSVSVSGSTSAGSVSSIKATQQQKEMMQMLRAMCGGDAGATVRPVQL